MLRKTSHSRRIGCGTGKLAAYIFRFCATSASGLLLLAAPNVEAAIDLSVEQFLVVYAATEQTNDPTGVAYLRALVGGAYDSYMYANAALLGRGDRQLFCQPEDVALSAETLAQMVRENGAAMSAERRKMPVTLALFAQLKERYPCM